MDYGPLFWPEAKMMDLVRTNMKLFTSQDVN